MQNDKKSKKSELFEILRDHAMMTDKLVLFINEKSFLRNLYMKETINDRENKVICKAFIKMLEARNIRIGIGVPCIDN